MSGSKYIPTGRTSLIKKDAVSLQVQTEYAYRPLPRLTTTILNNGQVLHKIEKKLDKEIESIAEQNIIEERIKTQHSDVIKIIKENDTNRLFESRKIPIPQAAEQDAGKKEESVKAEPSEEAGTKAVQSEADPVSLKEEHVSSVDEAANTLEEDSDRSEPEDFTRKFKEVEGVKYVYHLSPDGQFHSEVESTQFKKTFSAIFKNIIEMMEIFAIMPGGLEREKGVCEIQRNVLYLISGGEKIYFVVLDEPKKDINYEERFNQVINKHINLLM